MLRRFSHFARPVRNRGLFQRLSGFETGHPAAAGPLPAFDFSSSDEQDAVFLVSVMDCSDCDSSGLDSPNSSWSIARLKEYLRRKKMPSKREKKPSFWNVNSISTDVTSNPSFFFCSSFFSFISFSFLFLSCLLCPILLIYRNAARQVLLYFFCNPVSMHTACWPASRVGRSIGGSFTNFTSLALRPLVFRQPSIESGFIIWPTGVNCTLSFVPFSAS